MASFHDFEMTSINGTRVPLSTYKGQACLVVNVASQCGLTPQYEGLRELHHAHEDLTVLGFPCNQFGEQEPGTSEEIVEFCTTNYGIDFPLFEKIEVNGDGAHELYRWLKSEQPGDGDTSDITWNFEKFLIDADGNAVARFSPVVTPEQLEDELDKYI